MSKYTFKEIRQIIDATPAELKGLSVQEMDYNNRVETGYFQPSAANWSYKVYVIAWEDRLIEVATRFGYII